jgi:Tfp pilus assembly protein PilN
MKDFNFFEELVVSRKKKTSSSTYILLSAILLFAVLGLISFYYIQEFSALRDEKVLLQSQLNDPNHKKAYEEAQSLQGQLAEMEKEKMDIEKVHDEVLDSRVISSLLLKEISLAKPDAVAIQAITFTRDGVNISGSSISYDLIAKFEHNLRGNERFDGQFIPTIQKLDDEYYSFTLGFTFRQPEEPLEGEDVVNGEG